MKCPNCGGQRREVLAPGWFRCREEWLEPGWSVAPGQVDMYPVRCDQEYQDQAEGPDLGLCGCGFGAVGRCVRDGRPFCGQHRDVIDGGNHCPSCAVIVRSERHEAALRVWWDRYEQLPAGGPSELRKILREQDSVKATQSYRFTPDDLDELVAVADAELRSHGLWGKEAAAAIARWRAAAPPDLTADRDPLTWFVADPLCITALWDEVKTAREAAYRRRQRAATTAAYERRLRDYHARWGWRWFGVVLAIVVGLASGLVLQHQDQIGLSEQQVGTLVVLIFGSAIIGLGLLASMLMLGEHRPTDPDRAGGRFYWNHD